MSLSSPCPAATLPSDDSIGAAAKKPSDASNPQQGPSSVIAFWGPPALVIQALNHTGISKPFGSEALGAQSDVDHRSAVACLQGSAQDLAQMLYQLGFGCRLAPVGSDEGQAGHGGNGGHDESAVDQMSSPGPAARVPPGDSIGEAAKKPSDAEAHEPEAFNLAADDSEDGQSNVDGYESYIDDDDGNFGAAALGSLDKVVEEENTAESASGSPSPHDDGSFGAPCTSDGLRWPPDLLAPNVLIFADEGSLGVAALGSLDKVVEGADTADSASRTPCPYAPWAPEWTHCSDIQGGGSCISVSACDGEGTVQKGSLATLDPFETTAEPPTSDEVPGSLAVSCEQKRVASFTSDGLRWPPEVLPPGAVGEAISASGGAGVGGNGMGYAPSKVDEGHCFVQMVKVEKVDGRPCWAVGKLLNREQMVDQAGRGPRLHAWLAAHPDTSPEAAVKKQLARFFAAHDYVCVLRGAHSSHEFA